MQHVDRFFLQLRGQRRIHIAIALHDHTQAIAPTFIACKKSAADFRVDCSQRMQAADDIAVRLPKAREHFDKFAQRPKWIAAAAKHFGELLYLATLRDEVIECFQQSSLRFELVIHRQARDIRLARHGLHRELREILCQQ